MRKPQFHILVFSVLTLVGCGEVTVQGNATVERSELADGEVFYVSDALGTTRLESTESFEHLEFHVALADAELRLLDASGTVVLDWANVASFVEDTDPVAHEGALKLEIPADIIELRTTSGIDFARIAVGPDHSAGHEGEIPVPEGATTTLAAYPGRWMPPAHVVDAGNQQYLPYTGAPSRCSGTFLPGTRALAEDLRRRFRGAMSYGGYNCRPNSADPSVISVHGSGRAIDLFVPLSGGQADNDLGDPIAHHLIANAQRLGIEFIVWDRSSWGAHRSAPKLRPYTGSHPHHDHLHIELAPWAASNPSIAGHSPVGYMDGVHCSGINGWSQDPDAPDAATNVYVSVGGPVFTPGAYGVWTVGHEHRADLCDAIGSCRHGWYVKVPHGLMDGVPRQVFAYAEDATGGASSELTNSGTTLRCDPPSIPLAPAQAVRRPIPNPETLQRWGFQWNDIIRVSDAVLSSYTQGAQLPAQPTLQKSGAAVFVVEGGAKRHVPNGRAMQSWGFDWGAVRDANLAGILTKTPLEQRPYLIQGSGPGVFLLWPK